MATITRLFAYVAVSILFGTVMGFNLYLLAAGLGYVVSHTSTLFVIAGAITCVIAWFDRMSDMEGDGLHNPLTGSSLGFIALTLATASLWTLFNTEDTTRPIVFAGAVVLVLLSAFTTAYHAKDLPAIR